MSCVNQSSLFGPPDKYIKFYESDLVAIEGAAVVERLFLKHIRIPYTQLLMARIVLRPGQVDYLMNHLGLGDNATLVAIAAKYDPKSKVADDNYVQYNFADDLAKNRYFAQVMILTGNNIQRLPQLYLTNPNPDYAVELYVMVANIDDTYNFFNDTVNQSGLSFTGLEIGDIQTHVVGESIVFMDKSTPEPKPLTYLRLANINSLERTGQIVTIDDTAYGEMFFKFTSATHSAQAYSLLNYLFENPNVNIGNLNPVEDFVAPVVTFYSRVGGIGDFIAFNGATVGVPYNTGQGVTFSTTMSLATHGGTAGIITTDRMADLLVNTVVDNRDGTMSFTGSYFGIVGTAGTVSRITEAGTYSLYFNFSDFALNVPSATVSLTVTA